MHLQSDDDSDDLQLECLWLQQQYGSDVRWNMNNAASKTVTREIIGQHFCWLQQWLGTAQASLLICDDCGMHVKASRGTCQSTVSTLGAELLNKCLFDIHATILCSEKEITLDFAQMSQFASAMRCLQISKLVM